MANSPAADVEINEALIRALLSREGVAHETDPLTRASAGWDNEIWRLGTDRAVRLPRREVAARLIEHEQEFLPAIAERLRPAEILIPAPLVAGRASETFPRAWSVVPWIDGVAAIHTPRSARTAWAPQLAEALKLLHTAAPHAPHNPFRGVPLAARDGSIRERFAEAHLPRHVADAWDAGLAADPWSQDPVWIHGDLHPGNLIVQGDRLAAIIDFGDVTSGDPAYDLAAAWIVFDTTGRDAFMAALPQVDAHTWIRARAWAAAIAVTLRQTSDDNPAYARLSDEIVAELARASIDRPDL